MTSTTKSNPQTRASDLQVFDHGFSSLIKIGTKENWKLNEINRHNHCKLMLLWYSYPPFLSFFIFLFFIFSCSCFKVTSSKTITFQDVLSEARVKKLFIPLKNYVLFSRYSSFCIKHPIIYQICDVMMSISTWDRVHFWNLLNHNSMSHQTWPTNRYK